MTNKEWHVGMKQKHSARYTLIARFDDQNHARECLELLQKHTTQKEYDPNYLIHLQEEPHV